MIRVNKKSISLLGTLFIISQLNIARIIQPLGLSDFFNLQITFSDTLFLLQINEWKENGLLIFFNKHFIFDFFHPLIYTLFLLFLIQYELLKLGKRKKLLFLFPIIAGFSDLVENIFHFLFLQNTLLIGETTVFISALFSCIKWLFSLISGIIILVMVFHIIFKKVQKI